MEHTVELTSKKQTLEVTNLYKYDNLTKHLETCIDVIAPTLHVLPNFKEYYTPNNIADYYDTLKRNYQVKLKEWKNRGGLWKN